MIGDGILTAKGCCRSRIFRKKPGLVRSEPVMHGTVVAVPEGKNRVLHTGHAMHDNFYRVATRHFYCNAVQAAIAFHS